MHMHMHMHMHMYQNSERTLKPPLDATDRVASGAFSVGDPTTNRALDKKSVNPLQMTSIGAVLALLCAGTAAGFSANHAVAGAIRARPLLHLTHHAGHAHGGAAWSRRPIVPRMAAEDTGKSKTDGDAWEMAKELFVSFAPEQVLDENGQTLYAANGMLLSLLVGVLIGTQFDAFALPSFAPLGPLSGFYFLFAIVYASGILQTADLWETLKDQLATFAPKRVLDENGQALYAVNGTVPSLFVVVLVGGVLLTTGSFALEIIGFVLFCRAFRELFEKIIL